MGVYFQQDTETFLRRKGEEKMWSRRIENKALKMRAESAFRKAQIKASKDGVRRLVHKAVREGRLVRPATCSKCDVEGRLDAHHEDYGKPLEVVWLCMRCHKDVHMMNPIGEIIHDWKAEE